ncbi:MULTISPECIES: hypothetical protein [Nannocystis]|uniref:Lipoprotein n=2 Tax=Nannocystis TaxID=53 RepID=A0ABS7TTV0_9BACT|nr:MULTISPECIES: hypothetical protein [Nannocystis]MBZ5711672.1 hypothetical protein [Nannocystis pusilla]MCY1058201.1 hypothetical protein [Nannocystis sp. SCPEA4]MDC0675287.1 hypothetical protein [Nannocystis radixulma]
MTWKNLALVLSGILIGCAGGTVGHAIAQYPATAPRFEHMCMGPSSSVSGINDDVTQAANQGWELVTMTQGIVCFKRPRV